MSIGIRPCYSLVSIDFLRRLIFLLVMCCVFDPGFWFLIRISVSSWGWNKPLYFCCMVEDSLSNLIGAFCACYCWKSVGFVRSIGEGQFLGFDLVALSLPILDTPASCLSKLGTILGPKLLASLIFFLLSLLCAFLFF